MLKDIDLNTIELNEKVKRFKRYKKNELGWFQQFDNVNLDAGNCEVNADAFNAASHLLKQGADTKPNGLLSKLYYGRGNQNG